jgi:hypothetical protein
MSMSSMYSWQGKAVVNLQCRGFDHDVRSYVHDLSPKKQDKALIHAKRATNIRTVLIDKKTTAVESAQFR